MDVGLDGVAEWNLDCVDEVLAAGTDRSVTVILHFGTAETEFVGVAVQESLGVAGRIPVHSIEAQFVVLLLLTHFYQIYLIQCCGNLNYNTFKAHTQRSLISQNKFREQSNIDLGNITIKLIKIQSSSKTMPRNSQKGSNTSQKGKKDSKQTYNYATPRPKSATSSQNFDMTRSVMYSTFNNHQKQCLCKDCVCGRHLCSLKSPSPSLTLSSTYKMHYPPKKAYQHQPPSRPLSARQPQAPLLSGSSTYLDDFTILKGDPLNRPKPEDLLKCRGGHHPDLSSYRQEYPGHRGKNQYVPMNPEMFRGGLDFANGGSTYSKQFGHQRGKSAECAKPPDQFSMTGSWFGQSSYKDQYQNPKNHVSKDRNNKLGESQNFTKSQVSTVSQKNPSTHFKTTYGGDFRGNKRAVCPAALKAIEIESCLQKSAFKDNTDFKGFDSHYSSLAKYGDQF